MTAGGARWLKAARLIDGGEPIRGRDDGRLGCLPARAIRAATADAGEALGVGERLDRLASGLPADVIAVAGNPLTDNATLGRVALVIKEGVAVGPAPAVLAAFADGFPAGAGSRRESSYAHA